ncbi:MAG: hypothetical protein ACI9TH_004721 [Kiritimatiellia bacterium]
MRNHFALKTGQIYFVKWHLIGAKTIDYWYKELIVDLRGPTTESGASQIARPSLSQT